MISTVGTSDMSGGVVPNTFQGSADVAIRSSAGGTRGYINACHGANLSLTNPSVMTVGQDAVGGTFFLYQAFIAFDTSSLDDMANIVAARLSLFVESDDSDTDFTLEARGYAWTPETTEDWRDPAELGALPLLASRATSGLPVGQYVDFVSASGLPAAINKTGLTQFVINSSRNRLQNRNSGSEFVGIRSREDVNPPLLYVTLG